MKQKHSFETLDAVIRAMLDGQVFWSGTYKIYYDMGEQIPFRFEVSAVCDSWEYWREWYIEVPWEAELKTHNIACTVWDTAYDTRYIAWVAKQHRDGHYMDKTGTYWAHAEPLEILKEKKS